VWQYGNISVDWLLTLVCQISLSIVLSFGLMLHLILGLIKNKTKLMLFVASDAEAHTERQTKQTALC